MKSQLTFLGTILFGAALLLSACGDSIEAEDTGGGDPTVTPETPAQITPVKATDPDLWAELRRPVSAWQDQSAADACPVSQPNQAVPGYNAVGDGPIYANGEGKPITMAHWDDALGGFAFRFIWHISPEYDGPFLFRSLPNSDGHAVRLFRITPSSGKTGDFVDELTVDPKDPETVLNSTPNGWNAYTSGALATTPGCYAI